MAKKVVEAGVPSAVTGHWTESAILLAVATCPALFIAFAANPFEPHKAAVLWMAAAVACAAIAASATASAHRFVALGGWPRVVMVCAAFTIVAVLVSTARSEAPALAWWGSALRRDGALTQISLLTLLVATVVVVRDRSLRELLMTTVIVGSIGPTVYGLSQVFGDDAPMRAGSTFGNPLFFAGYLATVWPLTLARAVTEIGRLRTDRRSPIRTVSAWILLVLQSAAFVGAGSRGPVLALFLAIAAAALVLLATCGRRRLAAVLSSLTVVAVLCALGLAPPRMRASAAALSDRPVERSTATVVVRLILWEAAGRGIGANIDHLLFGAGPESTPRLVTRYAGPALQLLEGLNTLPDRAHNQTLETLASFGVVGLTLRLATVGAVLAATFLGLGLMEPRHSTIFAIGAAAVLAGAIGLATWTGGGLWAVAIGAPAALLLVIAGSVAAFRNANGLACQDEMALAMTAATTAWVAHFFEVQLGIETIAASLNAVVMMGVAVGFAWHATHGGAPETLPRPSMRVRREHDAMALLAGWSTAILTIGLAGPRIEASLLVWIVAATAWVLAAGVIEAGMRSSAKSAAIWVAVTMVWLLWRDASGLVDRLPLLYIAAATGVSAVSWFLTSDSIPRAHWMKTAAAPLLAGSVVAALSLRLTSGDVLAHAAAERQRAGDRVAAAQLYQDVIERDTTNDRALTELANVLIAEADAVRTAESRHAFLAQAERVLVRARVVNPFDYHHSRNLAALQRRWARSVSASERGSHLREADEHYVAATNLAPRHGGLWAEWGNLDAERQRPADAWHKLDHAASLLATMEAMLVSDALLRAQGEDIAQPAVLARLGLDLTRRGYRTLGAAYTRRATEAIR